MEGVLAHVVERISNPEVLFGLSVRFFGVFIVLGIVMIAIYLVGRVFVEIERGQGRAASPDAPEAAPDAGPAEAANVATAPASAEMFSDQAEATPSSSPVSNEAAVAVALALATVPGEVAVAVTLALDQAAREAASVPLGTPRATAPPGKGEPASVWKLLGRQEALFRRTSLTRPPREANNR
jgi:cytoskeletal protein RodZ